MGVAARARGGRVPEYPDRMPGAPADRRRFFRAALLGSVLALVIDVLMLSAGQASLLRPGGAAGSFFDVQARAMLDGHFWVDPTAAGIEGFVTSGRTYLYFGIVPSILRMPVLLVTHGLDGRMTQLSMLLAFVVLLTAGSRLHWRVRYAVRGDTPLGRTDLAVSALVPFALGAGAIPLFLASWLSVYHEGELWGAALTIAALEAIVSVAARPSGRRVLAAGVLATLAINTRFTVGLAPVAALSLLAAGLGGAMVARSRGPGAMARVAAALAAFGPPCPATGGRRLLIGLLAAAVVPMATYGVVNEIKFGQPFGIPLDRQIVSRIDVNRQAALRDNHGSLFGLKFAPSLALQYARPDAVDTVRAFPFIGGPSSRPTVVGDARFDTLEPSLSAPTSMLLFTLLTGVGLVLLIRRRDLRPLLGIQISAVAGFLTTLTIAYITTRYLADVLPFLLLGALVGLQATVAWAVGGSRARRRGVVAATGALVFFGLLVNGATGLLGQRLLYPGVSDADRAAFVRTQDDVDRLLSRRPHGIATGPELPARVSGAPGDLFILGRCDGLYTVPLSGSWLPVERTAMSGRHVLAVRFPPTTGGHRQTLITLGSGPTRTQVQVQGVATSLRFFILVGSRISGLGAPVAAPIGRETQVVLTVEPLFSSNSAVVDVEGRRAALGFVPYDRHASVTLGGVGGAPADRFTGTVRSTDAGAPLCRKLAGRAHLELQ